MFTNFFLLFAMIFTGAFLRKINLFDSRMTHGLNAFILYFAYPCMIVHNIAIVGNDSKLLDKFLVMIVVCVGLFALFAFGTKAYGKLRHFPERGNVAEFSMWGPNNGFMGLPVALMAFGQPGLVMMVAHNVVGNTFFITYGIAAMRRNNPGSGEPRRKVIIRTIWRTLLNPNIVSVILGFAIMFSGFQLEGTVIDQYLTTFGNIATPMAMIFIGSTLAEHTKLKDLKDMLAVEAALIKLIVVPGITFLLLFWLPLDPLIIATAVLGFALPTATYVCILAEYEGQDYQLACRILFLSTVLSMITVPFVITWLG